MKGNWTAYKEEYKSFYIDNLMTEYQKAGVNIAENFMDTSPSNGVLSFSPYTKRTGFSSQSANYGDSHYYYLRKDCEDEDTHPTFRFLSESGFQSEPSYVDYN